MKFFAKLFCVAVLLPLVLSAKRSDVMGRTTTTTTTSSSSTSTSTATVTVTAVVTTTASVTSTSSTVCASLSSITGTCRRRRAAVEEPIVYISEQKENEVNPSETVSVEATVAPVIQHDAKVAEDSISHSVLSSSKDVPEQNHRQARFLFTQFASFFSSLFTVAPTTTTTVTSTATATTTVTTSKTNTITFANCVPGTTWSVCGQSTYYGSTTATTSSTVNFFSVISSILSG